jgi:hypothetical protein
MTLAAGQTLTHYEILGPLGAGGMGEGYRARDTRLEREVAIKVLPEELADDGERLRRFEREAKALAALSHPNVAGIHGVDQAGDVFFLALELVRGEDLAKRLSRGPLPVDEAIDVCRQIAEGLEAAHEAGVVHRDLKPANVRVTPEGVAKILDFGLAKPIGPKAAREGAKAADSDSALVTEQGVVLGTPTYMSPEQARGKPVDRRTDVWALGCILYECLAGRRPFGGESTTDVLASIVGAEPDWSRLPGLPPRVFELLRRMLDKDPRLRLRDAGEARVLLSSGAGVAAQHTRESPRAGLGLGHRRVAALLVAVAVASGALGLWIGRLPSAGTRAETASPARAFEGIVLDFDEEATVTEAMISPDGALVAWVDGDGLHVRAIAERDPWTVVDSNRLGPYFAWSPDGRYLAYTGDGGLWTIGADGGTSRRICDFDGYYWSPLQWTEDRGIAYTTLEAIVARSEVGERTVLVEYDEQIAHLHGFILLPDRAGAIVVPHVFGGGAETIDVLRNEGRTELVATPRDEPSLVAFRPGRGLLWVGPQGLASLPLSEDLEVLGREELLLSGVAGAGLADDGTLFYTTVPDAGSQLGWIERADGAFSPIGQPHANIWGGSLSADGERVVFTVVQGSVSEIRMLDVERDLSVPWIWRDDGPALAGFSPDGRIQVLPLAQASRSGATAEEAFVYPASGEGEGERLDEWIVGATRDGSVLITSELPLPDPWTPNSSRTFASGAGVGGGPLELLGGNGDEFADLSEDGEWMLFKSSRAGRPQIYLTTFPPSAEEVRSVSADGGEQAWFMESTGEILFRHENVVYSVSFQAEPSVALGVPVRRFSLSPSITLTDFDGSGRFLGVRWRPMSKAYVDTDWGRVVGR